MNITTRQEAIQNNLRFYFTGKPCKYGHIDRRLLSDRTCCECAKIRSAKIYLKNPEEKKEQAAKWSAKNKCKTATYKEKFRAKNRESLRKQSAIWYSKNKLRRSITVAAWQRANKGAVRAFAQNRRARKGGLKLSTGLSSKLLYLQRGKCACCGKPLGKNYHMDHIVPLALGGENVDANIQLLRSKCNLEKSAKHPIDFMQSRGFLC